MSHNNKTHSGIKAYKIIFNGNDFMVTCEKTSSWEEAAYNKEKNVYRYKLKKIKNEIIELIKIKVAINSM